MMKHTAVYSGILITLLVVLASCTFKTPGAPIWTLEVNIPFDERSYKLSELISDSNYISENGYGIVFGDSTSILQFIYLDTLEDQNIGDELSYEPSDTGDYRNEVGLIQIEAPLPDTTITTSAEVFPGKLLPYRGPIDSVSFTDLKDTTEFDIFNWIGIHDGWLKMTVYNAWPFSIQDVKASYFNLEDMSLIGEIFLEGELPPESISADSIHLQGQILKKQLLMVTSGVIPGTEQNTLVRGSERLYTYLSLSESAADSANAKIAGQEFNSADSLDFDDPNKIATATIKSGWIFLSMDNSAPLLSNSNTEFSNILDEFGNPLTHSFTLHPGTSDEPYTRMDSINLAGKTISLEIDNQQLFVSSNITTEDSRITEYNGTSSQTIRSSNGAGYKYWTGELLYSSITGVIDSVQVEIPEQITEIDLPSGLDSVQFAEDTLYLDLQNGTSVPIKLDVVLEGKNHQNNRRVQIPIQNAVMPGSNRISIPDGDRLLTIVPDIITINGVAQIGSRFFPNMADSIVTISDTSGFSGTIELKSDLKLTLGSTELRSDPFLIDDGEYDHPIQLATVNLCLLNSIPLTGNVIILMGADTTAMDTIIELDLPKPEILNHRVVSAVAETLEVVLDEDEFEIIKQEEFYTQQIIRLQSTNNEEVWLYGEDSLKVQAGATIEYIVDLTDDGNGGDE